MKKEMIKNIVSWSLIAIVLILTFMVLKPIGIALIVGLLFGYILKPVDNKIRKLVKNKTLSTIILIILLVTLLVVPIIYFAPNIVKETYEVYGELKQVDIQGLITKIIPSSSNDEILYQLTVSFNNFIDKLAEIVMNYFSNIISDIADVLLQISVGIFAFFFVVRDYDLFLASINRLSPFNKRMGEKIKKQFKSVTNSVIVGQVLVGIIQGILMGVGFLVLGFDNVLVLTILSIVFGIIPIIGPWLVWIPVALFTLMQGDVTKALILAGYGFIFVSNIDNLIRPYLISKSSSLPIIVSLIGTVGGLMAFGIIGLIIGPLILSYALIVLETYEESKYTKEEKLEEKNEVKNKKI